MSNPGTGLPRSAAGCNPYIHQKSSYVELSDATIFTGRGSSNFRLRCAPRGEQGSFARLQVSALLQLTLVCRHPLCLLLVLDVLAVLSTQKQPAEKHGHVGVCVCVEPHELRVTDRVSLFLQVDFVFPLQC